MSSRGSLAFDAAAAAARAFGLDATQLDGDALAAGVGAAWARLSEDERLALGALVELGGAAGAGGLAQDLALDLQERGATPTQAARRVPAILEAAWEAGLVARDRASPTFYLPPEIAAALAPHVRAAIHDPLPVVGTPPQALVDDHLVSCTINLLRHDPLKLTREGTPFRRGLEGLAERLGALLPPLRDAGPDKGRLAQVEMLVAALRKLGLLRIRKDALEIDAERVEAWAASPEPERAASLLSPDAVAPARRLLCLMQDLALDRAVGDDWIARRLRRSFAASAESEPDAPWDPAEAARIAGAATLALERAGLLAITGNPGAGRMLALTAAGRSFPEPAAVARPKGMHVGHDLTVLVPRGLAADVHARLGDLARLESADQVARYRLDRNVLLESLDRGATAGELELFLAEHATPVLPDTVRDDLRRWAERFGEVTSRAGICVSCTVPRRHEEFAAVVGRSGLAVALVAPGVAVVAPEDHAALCSALAAAGLTPRRRVLPLPRGASSSVPPRSAAAEPARPPGPNPAEVVASLLLEPGWGSRFRPLGDRRAAPPPRAVVAQIKERYRREFGATELASLDALDFDELLAIEEKGQVRQFLSGRGASPAAPRAALVLDEYLGDEMVSVTPARARIVMEQAARTGLTCQVAYLQGPGRTQRLTVVPLELVSDGAGTYVRAAVSGSSHERMLATARIHAVRVVPAGREA